MPDRITSFFEKYGRWLVTSIAIIAMNFGILKSAVDNKIDSDQARNIVRDEVKENVLPKINSNAKTIEAMIKKDIADTDLQKEIKFNLKRFMLSQGVQYIEDTDKK